MTAVHSVTDPLAALNGWLDLERSRTLHAGGTPFGLETVTALAAALGPLSEPRASVHVAGSEGKTSVTERCVAGLVAAGLSAGGFTSPHLHSPLERLRVNGVLPSPGQVASAVAEVVAAAARLPRGPSWFEGLWATARVLFARLGLDATVWETGLGGRLDATRLSPAHVCVITSISLEHSAVLGPTLAAVAGEKAGILRPGVPLVLAPDLPREASHVIEARARELGCPITLAERAEGAGRGIALATAALQQLARANRMPACDEQVLAAVRTHAVAGREQLVDGVLYDGAHSEAAVADLARRLAPGPRAVLVFGATTGRDPVVMARALLPLAETLVLTAVAGERGVDPGGLRDALADEARRLGTTLLLEHDPQRALALARSRATHGRRILVTGSLYLVGQLMPPGSAPS